MARAAPCLRCVRGVQGFGQARDEFNAGRPADDALPAHEYGIIVCALRFFVPEMSPYYKTLWDAMPGQDMGDVAAASSSALVDVALSLRDEERIPIVALDVAGAEAGFPAKPHAPAYDKAHRNFLGKTVHAGEACVASVRCSVELDVALSVVRVAACPVCRYGPESVKQAVIDLHCQRLGHGFHTFNADAST